MATSFLYIFLLINYLYLYEYENMGLKVRYDNEEKEKNHDVTLSHKRQVIKLHVIVDNNELCNDFDILITPTWVTVNRNRNVLDVIIDMNKENERDGSIVLIHRFNSDDKFYFNIKQEYPDYSIYFEDGETLKILEINSLLNCDSVVNEKIEDIKLTCAYGYPYISTIREFGKVSNESEFVKVQYDKGLNVKIEGDILKINHYGKNNFYVDYYYEIVIKNKLDRYTECICKLEYKELEDEFSIKD